MRSQTGIIADAGFWETSILPIYEGNSLLNSAKIIPAAGAAVDLRLLELLRASGELIDPSGEVRPLSSIQSLDFLSLEVLEAAKLKLATAYPPEG
jgi:actin-related protein